MKFILENRILFLFLLAGLTVLVGSGIFFIRIDFSFESFYPHDDPEFIYYQEFEKEFPNGDNTVFLALKKPADKSIFDKTFLRSVDALFQEIEQIDYVDTVINPIDLQKVKRSGFGMKTSPVFDFDDPEMSRKAREWVETDTMISSNFFSRKGDYISGFMMLDTTILDAPQRDTACWKILDAVEATGMEHVVSGVPFVRTKYVEKTTTEFLTFLTLSIVFLIIFLALTYRSLWGVLVPLAGVIGALIWTLGLIGWTDKPIDLLSVLLPPILFVVGMADIIHLVTRYTQEVHKGISRLKAMENTLREIGVAILLTSITTAIGFLSLLVSRMPPIKEFGLYTAAGVIFAYLIAIVLVPNILLKIPPEKLKKSRGLENWKIWNRLLSWVYLSGQRYPARVLVFFAGIIVFSGIGISQISFNAFLLEDLRPGDPIRESMAFFEEEFYGLRQFEMAIELKEGHKATDLDVLRDMEKIENYLSGQTRMSPFISPVAMIKRANYTFHSNRSKYYTLPQKQEKVDELVNFILIGGGENLLGSVMTKDRDLARLNARMSDVGTDSMAVLFADFDQFVTSELPDANFSYRHTGMPYLTELNVTYLRQSLLYGLLLAFLIIGIMMGSLFKSWKMLFIAMIPNVIPLLFTAGIMGVLGISMKSSTSIVFVISFGIAVDDTIHFLSRLRVELREGRDLRTAVRNTVMGTGKALIMTTLILLSGFLILIGSDFGGCFAIGLFTTVTLIMALLSDLFLMPVLIRWLKPGIGKFKLSRNKEEKEIPE